jgi:hypothetical protein
VLNALSPLISLANSAAIVGDASAISGP